MKQNTVLYLIPQVPIQISVFTLRRLKLV